jgi:trypsin
VTEGSHHTAPPADFLVTTGSLDWSSVSAHLNHVSKVVINPAYNSSAGTSDIGLLVLSHAISNPTVRLAGAGDRSLEQPATPAHIAGWGDRYGGQKSLTTVLRSAPIVVQGAPYCHAQAPFPAVFNRSLMLCAQNRPQNNTATCQGDSGGPLVAMAVGNQPVEIGVTDYGYKGCPATHPSYFARVSAFRSWIQGWINRVAP